MSYRVWGGFFHKSTFGLEAGILTTVTKVRESIWSFAAIWVHPIVVTSSNFWDTRSEVFLSSLLKAKYRDPGPVAVTLWELIWDSVGIEKVDEFCLAMLWYWCWWIGFRLHNIPENTLIPWRNHQGQIWFSFICEKEMKNVPYRKWINHL